MVESKDAWSVSRDCVMSELAIRGDIVCRAPDRLRSPASYDEWPARARLIAAAPALLEALQDFSRHYDGFQDGDGNPCPQLLKARAAIALALSQEGVGHEDSSTKAERVEP